MEFVRVWNLRARHVPLTITLRPCTAFATAVSRPPCVICRTCARKKVTSGGASEISSVVSQRLYWARPACIMNCNSVRLGDCQDPRVSFAEPARPARVLWMNSRLTNQNSNSSHHAKTVLCRCQYPIAREDRVLDGSVSGEKEPYALTPNTIIPNLGFLT